MYYACETASVSKACLNRAHVPESWLRGVVIEKVQERILGMKVGDLNLVAGSSPSNPNEGESDLGTATFELNDVTNLPWFTELFDIVSDEFKNLKGDQESAMIALQQEAKKLDNQINGWLLSLSSLELPMDTRKLLEQEIDAASNRKQELQNIIERQNSALAGWNSMVTHGAVLQRLQKLASVLGKLNASRINVELSLHIDRISCYRDGHVCLRLCRLGLAPDIIDVLQLYQMEPGQETTPTLITPRRRSRRRISTGEAPSIELNALTIWAAEPHRFKGLPACFFEEYDFNRPEPEFWYQQHAKAVAEKRKMGMSHDELAELYRPGHADEVWDKKFGIRDHRGGGRSSARAHTSAQHAHAHTRTRGHTHAQQPPGPITRIARAMLVCSIAHPNTRAHNARNRHKHREMVT